MPDKVTYDQLRSHFWGTRPIHAKIYAKDLRTVLYSFC